MTTYKYKAQTPEGMTVSGVVEAVDQFAAADKIKETCPIILSIEAEKEKENSILDMEIGSGKINMKSLSIACSQIAITLRAGIPLARCLELIGNQTEDKGVKKFLLQTAEDVSGGASLSASMEKYGKGLPITFIETIRAGEQTGNIEESFQQMADYYDKMNKTKEKVKQALSYPIFVVVVAIVVLIIVMAFVIPSLTQTFESLGANLPIITVILINISHFFQHWWGLIALVIVAIVFSWKAYVRTEKGKEVQGKIQLKMPGLGKIHTMSGAADFANTMAMLLNSGITVNNAVEITAKTLGNYIQQSEIDGMVGKIEEGHSLGECMRSTTSFPRTLCEMCAIGEESGELSSTLEVIGDFYSNETDVAIKAAISKLEPTMLIFLALFAGFIVIAIYMPMFTMYNYM